MKHEDIQIGQILPVAEFNKLAEDKWQRRCDENRGTNNPMPQLAFYVFADRNGNYKKSGFVLKTSKDGYRLFKLKRTAVLMKEQLI